MGAAWGAGSPPSDTLSRSSADSGSGRATRSRIRPFPTTARR